MSNTTDPRSELSTQHSAPADQRPGHRYSFRPYYHCLPRSSCTVVACWEVLDGDTVLFGVGLGDTAEMIADALNAQDQLAAARQEGDEAKAELDRVRRVAAGVLFDVQLRSPSAFLCLQQSDIERHNEYCEDKIAELEGKQGENVPQT